MNQVPDSKEKPHSSKTAGEFRVPFKEMKKLDLKDAQNIVLTSGCLQLSLKFPADSVVKFREKNKETYLMRGFCYCKNSPVPVFYRA